MSFELEIVDGVRGRLEGSKLRGLIAEWLNGSLP